MNHLYQYYGLGNVKFFILFILELELYYQTKCATTSVGVE